MYIYNMSDQPNETIDDAGLTKPKKKRSEAQIAATERMRSALEAKQLSSSKITPEEKKLRLQAIKEQLNGPLKKNMEKKESEPESEPESEEEEIPPPKKPLHKKSIKKEAPPKKEPKVVYESESESDEEVIVIKKKKKPKKKTIIYEEESEEEEEPVKPVRKERETKTQQNSASKFKVTPGVAAPPKSIYYFAD